MYYSLLTLFSLKAPCSGSGDEEDMQQLEEVVGQAKAEIEGVSDIAALDEIRVKYLGKKGFYRADEGPGRPVR